MKVLAKYGNLLGSMPLIGELVMHKNWFHYAMSWGGMLYDLVIPFLLLYKRSRLIAFLTKLEFCFVLLSDIRIEYCVCETCVQTTFVFLFYNNRNIITTTRTEMNELN